MNSVCKRSVCWIFVICCLLLCQGFSTFAYGDESGNDQLYKQSKGKKKLCVFYGNCQMAVVMDYLKTHYPNRYDYHLIVNYIILNDVTQLPVDLLKTADLFIFQPIQGHGMGDTEYIKNNILKKKCKTISFPYIYFRGYFPDYVHDPNNVRTVSQPRYPFGIFGSGHQKIMDYIAAGVSPNEIINKCMQLDLLTANEVNDNLKSTLNILKERESSTDVKISAFIAHYYKKTRLFHTAKHPTNYLLKELMRQILIKMKLNARAVYTSPFFDKELLQFESTDIIYPSVAQILGLQFDISAAFCHYDHVSFVEFINDYIKYLYPEYYDSFQ